MENTALLLIDLQNDFLHPDGAYTRGGVVSNEIGAVPGRLKPVARAIKECGGKVISTHFTLVPGKNGEPIVNSHLRKLRPFLAKGDFAPGSFGHALVDELSPADFSIEKIAYSAFYMSRLEWVLRQVGISNLIVGGIVTNGGITTTVRDAHVRGYHCTVLADGCAAFDANVHRVSIESMMTVADIISCKQICQRLNRLN